jgi:hypothetical protein
VVAEEAEEPQPVPARARVAGEPAQWRQAPATGLAPVRRQALREAQRKRCCLPAVSCCIHRLPERLTS